MASSSPSNRMTPNPNPSPELIAAVEKLTRPIIGMENRTPLEVRDILFDRIRSQFAALSPQTLPAPGEVERLIRSHFEGAIFREEYTENGHRQVDDHDACERVDDLVRDIMAATLTPTLATVAAANDEGVAKAIRLAIWGYVNAQPEEAAILPVVQFLANRDVFLAEAIALATSRSQHEGAE